MRTGRCILVRRGAIPSRTLRITEAAELIGCSVSSLKRWESEPDFPGPGRSDAWKKWRIYTLEDIERIKKWLESRITNG
jgi:DNA-binding transcriptional MerR regulator